MRWIIVICVLVIVALLLIAQFGPSLVRSETVRLTSPIFGATIPDRYRDWKMIAVAHEEVLDELRGVLGNDVAVKAYHRRTLPVGSCPMEGSSCLRRPGKPLPRLSSKLPKVDL
jgi:hypothetical protein